MSAMKQHSQNFSYFHEVNIPGLKAMSEISAVPLLVPSQMIENRCPL